MLRLRRSRSLFGTLRLTQCRQDQAASRQGQTPLRLPFLLCALCV